MCIHDHSVCACTSKCERADPEFKFHSGTNQGVKPCLVFFLIEMQLCILLYKLQVYNIVSHNC